MKRKMVCLLTALVSVALILASCGGQSGEKLQQPVRPVPNLLSVTVPNRRV